VWVDDWAKLPSVLEEQRRRPVVQVVAQQQALRAWYVGFMTNHTKALEAVLDAHLEMGSSGGVDMGRFVGMGNMGRGVESQGQSQKHMAGGAAATSGGGGGTSTSHSAVSPAAAIPRVMLKLAAEQMAKEKKRGEEKELKKIQNHHLVPSS
jgi:hypothetical protein